MTKIAISCSLVLVNLPPAFSQFLTTKVSRHEWGLNDLSRIEFAQVSVIQGRTGDSLLIYALRDSIPPPPLPHVEGMVPRGSGMYFILSDFAYSQMNTLGGAFDTYEREPSTSSAKLADTKDGDRALSFAFDRGKKGYCGMWIQLFNSFDPPESRVYLNAKPFSTLTLWIRGEAGGEHLTLKVADARWVQKEDALTIGDLGSFLPGGRIDTAWREAVIPLDKFPASLNRTQLGSLVFEPGSNGKGRVELKTLALCVNPAERPPLTRTIPSVSLDGTRKAIWVWDTKTMSENREREHQFVEFLVQQNFTEAFLEIPYDPGSASQSGALTVNHALLNPLIASLHSRNIRVDALIGDKNFALPEWHPYVKSTVENIIRFNRESTPSERFDGIHLDVEPYLLPGFNGPRHKEILEDYLKLLSDVADQAHDANLVIGADIPFWYSERDQFTHEVGTMPFRGTTKPVHQHILDIVDNIAVMSYRTKASGMDGIVAHSLDEIMYAQQMGKTVFVGLETGSIADERVLTFRGRPQTGKANAFRGDQLFLISSGDTLTCYLISENQSKDFASFLQSMAVDQERIYHWATNNSVTVSGARLSFATLGLAEFRRTMNEALLELRKYKSFGGFAIHHYSSYKGLLDSPAPR